MTVSAVGAITSIVRISPADPVYAVSGIKASRPVGSGSALRSRPLSRISAAGTSKTGTVTSADAAAFAVPVDTRFSPVVDAFYIEGMQLLLGLRQQGGRQNVAAEDFILPYHHLLEQTAAAHGLR